LTFDYTLFFSQIGCETYGLKHSKDEELHNSKEEAHLDDCAADLRSLSTVLEICVAATQLRIPQSGALPWARRPKKDPPDHSERAEKTSVRTVRSQNDKNKKEKGHRPYDVTSTK
jgi:hypothetical protein